MDAINFRVTRKRVAQHKLKLTDRRVQNLKPNGSTTIVWDSVQRGLGLRIQPTGHKSWVVIYRHNRKPRWLTFPAVPVQAAREKAAEVTLAVMRGQDPAPKNLRSTTNFSTVAQRYVEEHSSKKNKSWKHADKLVRRYLLPSWAKVDVTAITRADIRSLISKIQAPMLANQVRLAASAIFTWAVSQDLVPHNPCRGIEGNATTSRERILSDEEVKLFMQAFRQAGNAGRALQILLLTGARPGEVARMRHEQIKDGWWELPGKADGHWPGTKNGISHRVWLVPAVRELIGDQKDRRRSFSVHGQMEGQPSFSSPVFKRRPAIRTTMQRLCRELNVPRCTPHDLRRTFGSTVTKLGFGRPAMDRLLNHADKSVGSVYDRYGYAAEDQKIWAAVAQHLLALSR
jgi:integrase